MRIFLSFKDWLVNVFDLLIEMLEGSNRFDYEGIKRIGNICTLKLGDVKSHTFFGYFWGETHFEGLVGKTDDHHGLDVGIGNELIEG